MANYKKDYNLLSLSIDSSECIVDEFNGLEEVSAKFLYIDLLKAVKEVISDDKITYLINLSQVLERISKMKSAECFENYQRSDQIGNFNLVTLACKNKAIKVLNLIFYEETQTLYNLCVKLTGVSENGELLSVQDEFCHNAFYYAIRSNMPVLLNILVDKWPSEYSNEELDDILSQSYNELLLRNVLLTTEMQLFFHSKILDLRFFPASTAENNRTGNSCEQIKERIKLVVESIRSIEKYQNKDPDENFICIAKFIAKSVHILKLLMQSTYDRFPWEEIELCLLVFIACCEDKYEWNLMYNCVLNKKRILMHLSNFLVLLDTFITKDDGFKKNDVILLAKPLKLKRDVVIEKIVKEKGEFRKLYDDYGKLRDYCSLVIIEGYADLIELSDVPGKLRYLLISRVLQVMGEHFKDTLYSPKLSTKTADALLSSLSVNTREIVTNLRDSLSHDETLLIRSEIEKKSYILKKMQTDISRIKNLIPGILYRLRIASVQNLMEKVRVCKSIEEIKECYGPYQNSLDLLPKVIDNTNIFKSNFESLEESLTCLDENMKDKTEWETKLFDEIYYLIQKEKRRFENLKKKFHVITKSVSHLKLHTSGLKSSSDMVLEMAKAFANFPIEAPSEVTIPIEKKLDQLLISVMPRILRSKDREANDILRNITVFLKFEIRFVKSVEEFRDAMCLNKNTEKCQRKEIRDLSVNLLTSKLSQLKEALIDFDLKVNTVADDFSSFEKNRALKAVTEMLVLDILGILESSRTRNTFFLDNDFPLLTGRNLRNHLSHENILINVILGNSALQIFITAKHLLEALLSKDNKEMYKVIKCDYKKLKISIESAKQIVENQRNLFVALGEGEMKGVEECLKKGADVYGRDYNVSTCLHFAGKAPGIEAVKWCLKQHLSTDSKDSAGKTVLHIAAEFNRIQAVQHLVENEGMSLAVIDSNDDTPLHLAVEKHSNKVVEYILKFNIFTTKKNMNGSTPLHLAINSSNYDAAMILLDKGTNVDKDKANGNCTALHVAILSNNVNLVEILIDKKSSIYSKNDNGDTPLHAATYMKHLEVMEVLVVNGADVNAKNEGGITPLMDAAEKGSMEMVNFLLRHGADVSVSDFWHRTALMRAARYGHTSVTELLLQKGADINSQSIFGLTPLCYAALGGHYKVVEVLLKHKAIIDFKNNKKTALHISAERGHKEIVELLLKEKAESKARDSTNSSPLHLAASAGHKDIVQILIDKGAGIDFKDEKGLTALHYAALNRHKDIVGLFLEKGADIRASDSKENSTLYWLIRGGFWDLLRPEEKSVNSSDSYGSTLLHEATSAGDQKIVEYCIENNCDINARTNTGLTALHLAVHANYQKIISFLLNKGAEIDSKDDDGRTPLLLAVRGNYRENVEILVTEMEEFKFTNEDKIKVLEESIIFGYHAIFDILQKKFKCDVTNDLLNIAVTYNHKHIVDKLLARGSEINGNTKPLHVAVRHSYYDMAEFLLTKGANPNLLDETNCSPFDIAVELGDVDMLEVLSSGKVAIERKLALEAAESAIRKKQLETIKRFLERKVIDTGARGNYGYTLLHMCALFGSLDITRYLVTEGADINAKDENQNKPVHIAVEKGFNDVVEFYLNCKDLGDETASLMLAAISFGQANVCELLIDRNADVNGWHANDENLINLAVAKDHKEVVYVLLKYGAYYNAHPSINLDLTKENEAASLLRKVERLFTAVQRNKPSDVKNILKGKSYSKYCLANAKCIKKQTVLHYASWKGYKKIVKVLLKHNTNPNALTKTGGTPLHYAVKYSHFKIVKSLLSNGAIFNALSKTGKTPLEFGTDKKIRNLLLSLRYIFAKVQDKDPSVLEILESKDKGMMRVLVRAKNKEGNTLIEVAHIYGFTKTSELQKLFERRLQCEDLLYPISTDQSEPFLEYEALLRKRVQIFGADSPPVLDTKLIKAYIFQNQGNLDRALDLFREIYKGIKNSLGEDHVEVLLRRFNITCLLLQQGKIQGALQIFEAIHIKLKEKLESDGLRMLNFKQQLSFELYKMNKFNKVLEINNEAEQICAEKTDVLYRLLLAQFQFLTALVLRHQKEFSKALRIFRKVYKTRKEFLTLYNPETLTALFNVAEVLNFQKRYDESLEKHKEVLDIRKSRLPADHIDILESEYHVGEGLYKQEMLLSALRVFLSLEPKIAVLARDRGLREKNRDKISAIRYELLSSGLEIMFDSVRNCI